MKVRKRIHSPYERYFKKAQDCAERAVMATDIETKRLWLTAAETWAEMAKSMKNGKPDQ